MSSYLYFIIPLAIVVFALKCCFLFWRIYFYQQRRERQRRIQVQIHQAAVERERAARLAAQRRTLAGTRGTSVTRIVTRREDGTQQVFLVPTACLSQMIARREAERSSGAVPNAPLRVVLTPEDILTGASGRRNDPNMPPSYDQAVTGKDKSVKVEEGTAKWEDDIPPPEYTVDDDDQPLLS